MFALIAFSNFHANANHFPNPPGKHKITSISFQTLQAAPGTDTLSCIIPFSRAGNLIILRAKADTTDGNFILDTGAPGLVLNITYFRDYPATVAENEEQTGITGAVAAVTKTQVSELALGCIKTNMVAADLLNLGHLETVKGIRILGLLGLSVFKQFEMIIDYENSLLYLHRIGKKEAASYKHAMLKDTAAYSTVPIEIWNHKILTTTVLAGKKLKLIIDSGAESSKPLFSSDNITDPAEKIIFTSDEGSNVTAPANQVHFGFNRYKNKAPFAVSDSIVNFFLRGNTNANSVKLAGSFTRWQHGALAMTKTDSGWIARVKLAAGKHLYKFIIDGNWTVDRDDINNENDGMGNDNSVFYKTNYTFKLDGYSTAKRVYLAGSFNGWRENELQMQRTPTGWAIPVYLSEGTHTYRFIADGNWFADPANPDKLPNEFNEYNSVIRLGKPYIFKLDGFANAKKITILGSFNNWKEDELFMNRTATGWELPYTLGPGSYEYKLKIDDNYAGDSLTQGNLALVISPNFTFRLKGFADAKTVCVSGDMNNWNPVSFRMKRQGDEWIFNAHLNKGKHIYKFVIDGKWILDPANKLWEQNEYGTNNSVLWIEND